MKRTTTFVCWFFLSASGIAQTTDIRELKLRDWMPESTLSVKRTEIIKPVSPVIDVHNHLGAGRETLTEKTVQAYLRAMDDAGVQTVVNLDGGWGKQLLETLNALDRRHPKRFLTFALLDFSNIDDPDWTKREVSRLREGFEAGAKGLKFFKELGLGHRLANKQLLPIDSPKLDPIWKLCAEYKRPVMIHTADPAAFFRPLDHRNERWHELNEHPDWLFYGKDFPSREELLAQRNRVIEKHPKTTFIGAHFGNNPEDLKTVGKWLDQYPNFYIDIDARINELGRQPYTARRFFLKYQDRIMFGTDIEPNVSIYRTYYRFLESDDEYWDTAETLGRQGFWNVYGIFLPKSVLEKIYHTNAQRILMSK